MRVSMLILAGLCAISCTTTRYPGGAVRGSCATAAPLTLHRSLAQFYASYSIDVSLLPAQEVAEALTYTDRQLFNAITPEELRGVCWTKKDKMERAKNVMNFIGRFNSVTLFCMTSVTRLGAAKERAHMISFLVQVADNCCSMSNFNACKAIIGALQSAPVHRLRRTWEILSTRARNKFDVIVDKLQELRTMLDELDSKRPQPAVIPFLGMFLTELVYIDAALGKIPDEQSARTEAVVRRICSYQRPPDRPSIYALDVHLRVLRVDDEDVNYRRSLQLEPRDGNVGATAIPVSPAYGLRRSYGSLAIASGDTIFARNGLKDPDELSRASLAEIEEQRDLYRMRVAAAEKDAQALYRASAAAHLIQEKTDEMWDMRRALTRIEYMIKSRKKDVVNPAVIAAAIDKPAVAVSQLDKPASDAAVSPLLGASQSSKDNAVSNAPPLPCRSSTASSIGASAPPPVPQSVQVVASASPSPSPCGTVRTATDVAVQPTAACPAPSGNYLSGLAASSDDALMHVPLAAIRRRSSSQPSLVPNPVAQAAADAPVQRASSTDLRSVDVVLQPTSDPDMMNPDDLLCAALAAYNTAVDLERRLCAISNAIVPSVQDVDNAVATSREHRECMVRLVQSIRRLAGPSPQSETPL